MKGRAVALILLAVLALSCETERRMPERAVLQPRGEYDTLIGGHVLGQNARYTQAVLIHWVDFGGLEAFTADTIYRRVVDVTTERGTLTAERLDYKWLQRGDTIRFRKSALR